MQRSLGRLRMVLRPRQDPTTTLSGWGVSSSRRGMKRRSWFSGARTRIVPASGCAHPDPNAWADMPGFAIPKSEVRGPKWNGPSSIFAGMLSPGLTEGNPGMGRGR